MPSPRSSAPRRALHQRTPSETNKDAASRSSVRLVATPYPTKPQHVLAPTTTPRLEPALPISDSRSPDYPDDAFDAENRQSRKTEHHDDEEDDDEGIGIAVLPADTPTIKTVVGTPPTPETPPQHNSAESSPNVVALGSSSPAAASPNYIRLGNSSSSSGVSSVNSMGTVVRHGGPWFNSSDYSRSRSPSHHSHAGSVPPVPSIPSIHSSPYSIPPVPPIPPTTSRDRSVSSSDRGLVLQYATIRAPSGSSQQAEITTTHHSHSRDVSRASSQAIPSTELGILDDDDDDANRIVRPTHPAIPASSSTSQSSPAQRPPIIPTWIKAYYRSDGKVVDEFPPSPARSLPPILIQPKTRSPEKKKKPRSKTEDGEEEEDDDPRDPRNHWVREPSRRNRSPRTPILQPARAWSPHLLTDREFIHKRSVWSASSIDSRAEPAFGMRNIQVYCFCLGFIMPLGESLEEEKKKKN